MKAKLHDRVLIVGFHPWCGHIGIVTEKIQTPVGVMWRVELDNGCAAGVQDENLEVIEAAT